MKLKKGYFYDIQNNMTVKYLEMDAEASNNGYYYHHDWVGPFKTFLGAKRAGLKELQLELNMAQSRFNEFAAILDVRRSKK